MNGIAAGKPAAQSRTRPNADRACSAVFCRIHRLDKARRDSGVSGQAGELQRKFEKRRPVISRQSTAILL